jgi:hypothetical protein
MNATDHETKITELRQLEFDARAELRSKLLEGSPTGPTRKQIAEFARSLKAEVARFSLDAETARDIRQNRLRDMAVQLSDDARAEIAKRLAPLALPAPIQDFKK